MLVKECFMLGKGYGDVGDDIQSLFVQSIVLDNVGYVNMNILGS